MAALCVCAEWRGEDEFLSGWQRMERLPRARKNNPTKSEEARGFHTVCAPRVSQSEM